MAMRTLFIVAGCLLVACGQAQPAALPTDQVESVMSWAATAHDVGAAWLSGRVPAPYARMTLQTADQELVKAREELGHAQVAGSDARVLQASLAQVIDVVAPMAAAVEHSDRRSMEEAVAQLASSRQALAKLAGRAEQGR